MSASNRGGLKAAFTNFNKAGQDKEAEIKLLGRTTAEPPESYQVATTQTIGSLTPKPLLHREAVRQLSFRCPASVAGELRRKAAFNQLEQQEIIIEGIKRVLLELPDPPAGWEN